MLSDSDSESESAAGEHALTINAHYAKAFAYRKEREELQKLKEKYGSDADDADADAADEDDDSDTTEDEDGEELTPAVDAAILRTLARIRRRDPAIYDADKGIFQEEEERTKGSAPTRQKRTKESKPLTIQQQRIADALEGSRSPSPEPHLPTHVAQQTALRSETISAFHAPASDDEDEDDALLVLRDKTTSAAAREEEEYRAYLEREVAEDLGALVEGAMEEDVVGIREAAVDGDAEVEVEKPKKKGKKERKAAKEVQTNGSGKAGKGKGKEKKAETDQEFLMNYILNRGWIDHSAGHVPTWHEVTGPDSGSGSKTKSKSKADAKATASSEGMEVDQVDGMEDEGEDDDGFDDVADTFELSYNFRFEEPDAAKIPAFPRAIPSTVRHEDTKRKDARARRKERKDAEVQTKKEEIRRMKALKMKELKGRLERIGRKGGAELGEDALGELNLDAEWDPAAHDEQMQKMYGGGEDLDDGFHAEGVDAEAGVNQEKPTWEDDIDIDDILPSSSHSRPKDKKKKKKEKNKGTGEGGDDGVDVEMMDADADDTRYGDGEEEEEWDGTEEMRKRKLDEYLEELYEMEFNDIVAGQPTRFTYTPVAPSSFALTPAEILLADDADLNEYVGLRRIAPYRRDAQGRKNNAWDKDRGERLRAFKEKLGARGRQWGGYAGGINGDGEEPLMKKRKGKKERERAKAAAAEAGAGAGTGDYVAQASPIPGVETADGEREGKKKKRRKHKGSAAAPAVAS